MNNQIINGYYVYGKDNLFLHYDKQNRDFFFSGGFESALKFYFKETILPFEKNTLKFYPYLKGGKWFFIKTTINYEIEEMDF